MDVALRGNYNFRNLFIQQIPEQQELQFFVASWRDSNLESKDFFHTIINWEIFVKAHTLGSSACLVLQTHRTKSSREQVEVTWEKALTNTEL